MPVFELANFSYRGFGGGFRRVTAIRGHKDRKLTFLSRYTSALKKTGSSPDAHKSVDLANTAREGTTPSQCSR
jgi:hypothetical protein